MEDLPISSSTSSHGGHCDLSGNENPSAGLQSPTTTGNHRHICHFWTFLVSSLFTLFNGFGNSISVDQSMEETSSASPSGVTRENQNANTNACQSTAPYHVFINHRGPHVRKTLASIVHYLLQHRGLQVFLDTREFQPGEDVEPTVADAIITSSIHIAIFSKTYAESVWCLKELCLMLETGAKIIPVFYDVRPNDLRRIERGQYASAFAKHEKNGRFGLKTMAEWKSALGRVSYFSGLDLQDPKTFNGNGGQLLRSLEDTVSQYLKWPVPLEGARDPVGLDEAIQDFGGFVGREQPNENEKVKIVGIVGLGGSGKTTLAKEFYNRKRFSFNGSSFLCDVREISTSNALPSLQSKLLGDLLRVKGCKIDSVSEGKEIVRDRLKSSIRRVLIILDDIDHPNQVEALLVRDALGSGSMIIVTSRDVNALKCSGASPIYKIKGLSPEHAQELFCMHAFEQPTPRTGFEELVKRFCEKCGGLPLFLKIMGAHLRAEANDDKEDWKYDLEHIHDDMVSILNVSYKALHKEEKQMFLDIACFFLGQNKISAIRVWDTSQGRGSRRRLKNLENKCLVELDGQNCFKMHDHVRDFGRGIAKDVSLSSLE